MHAEELKRLSKIALGVQDRIDNAALSGLFRITVVVVKPERHMWKLVAESHGWDFTTDEDGLSCLSPKDPLSWEKVLEDLSTWFGKAQHDMVQAALKGHTGVKMLCSFDESNMRRLKMWLTSKGLTLEVATENATVKLRWA